MGVNIPGWDGKISEWVGGKVGVSDAAREGGVFRLLSSQVIRNQSLEFEFLYLYLYARSLFLIPYLPLFIFIYLYFL